MISSDFEFADFSESHEVKSLLVLFFFAGCPVGSSHSPLKALESHFPAAVYVSSS